MCQVQSAPECPPHGEVLGSIGTVCLEDPLWAGKRVVLFLCIPVFPSLRPPADDVFVTLAFLGEKISNAFSRCWLEVVFLGSITRFCLPKRKIRIPPSWFLICLLPRTGKQARNIDGSVRGSGTQEGPLLYHGPPTFLLQTRSLTRALSLMPQMLLPLSSLDLPRGPK